MSPEARDVPRAQKSSGQGGEEAAAAVTPWDVSTRSCARGKQACFRAGGWHWIFCLSLLGGANWHEKWMQVLWSWVCVEVPSSSSLAQGEVVALGSSPRPRVLPDRDVHGGKRSSLTRPPFPFLHSLRMLLIAVGQQMDLCCVFFVLFYI